MKRMLVCAAWCLMTLMSYAQTVAVVNLMKVPQGGYDAFIANELEWKKLHQNRVNEGKMISWQVYYIHNQGTGSPYNCATVDVYPSLEASLAGMTQDEMKKGLGEKYNDVLKKTNTVRNLVYSETLGWAMGISPKAPDKYLMVSSMKAKDVGKYYAMEEKAYMPVHQAAIDQGKMNSWAVWGRWFPEDNMSEAYTVNGYTTAAQISSMDYNAAMEKAKEGKSTAQLTEMIKLMDETESIRTIVKAQLWELVDATTPKK
jgi:hypothetical protein